MHHTVSPPTPTPPNGGKFLKKILERVGRSYGITNFHVWQRSQWLNLSNRVKFFSACSHQFLSIGDGSHEIGETSLWKWLGLMTSLQVLRPHLKRVQRAPGGCLDQKRRK